MKIPMIATSLIVGGSAMLWGLLVLMIKQGYLEPDTLKVFPPLVLLWTGLCIIGALFVRTHARKTQGKRDGNKVLSGKEKSNDTNS